MVEFMQDEGKVYEGEITLGYSTTTEDASGEVSQRLLFRLHWMKSLSMKPLPV